jgi:hypothetical protein
MFPISYSVEPGFKKTRSGKFATTAATLTIEAPDCHAPAAKTAKVALT